MTGSTIPYVTWLGEWEIMINKRQLLHILSWTILFAGIAGGYLSYRYRQGVNAGNYAASLLGAGKLDQAIEYATKAIELQPDDGMGNYVRGAARFRLITEKHAKESLFEGHRRVTKQHAAFRMEIWQTGPVLYYPGVCHEEVDRHPGFYSWNNAAVVRLCRADRSRKEGLGEVSR